LRGRLFTIFTACVVSVFLACFYNACACDRFSALSYPLKRAVYSTPDSQCLECYIYRLSTLDTMQKIGVWEWVVILVFLKRETADKRFDRIDHAHRDVIPGNQSSLPV